MQSMDETETIIIENDKLVHDYFKKTRFKIMLIIALAVMCVLCISFSVTVSGLDISPIETYEVIFKHITNNIDNNLEDYIVWDLNLPRALFAIITGAGLAVAGVAMQNIMKNPLADPYTTGISSGASLGMAVVMCAGITMGQGNGSIAILLMTFIMSLIPTAIILLLLPKRNTSPATIILIGISLSYFFNAFDTVLLTTTDADTLARIYTWQVGTFQYVDWSSIPFTLGAMIVGSSALMVMSNKLNIIALGDDEATSLGVDAETYRLIILVVLSLMVSMVVAYAGIIGFVGLVAPHVIRSIIGSNNKFLIPTAMLAGSLFLLGCDILCRMVNSVTLPVGTMASLIGGPIFVYVVLKSKNMW